MFSNPLYWIIFILGCLTVFVVNILIGLFSKRKIDRESYDLLAEQHRRLKTDYEIVTDSNTEYKKRNDDLNEILRKEMERANEMERGFVKAESENKFNEEKLKEHKIQVEQLNEKFHDQFENLANKILQEKGEKFNVENQKNLSLILEPLKDRIASFEKQIQDKQLEDAKQRATLLEQFKQLGRLNQQMSTDAQKLTKALKGDSKTQGNWGEMILESILEKSGLLKGREYKSQQNFRIPGRRFQPDIVINLPEDRQIIIDSKVSLTAYERFCSEDDPKKSKMYLKAHIDSVKNHIRQLSGKNYQQLYQLRSLDFVLLFIPLEPAFGLAIQHDSDLFAYGFKQNIIIVSPTTLLATLRTIANIWRHEKQSKNALEIARESGRLYDKFVGFVEDMENISRYLSMTEKSFDKAMGKLYLGDGNMISKAEKIREMGALNSKTLKD